MIFPKLFQRFLGSKLGRFIQQVESQNLWRFDDAVVQFLKSYRYSPNDQATLERGLACHNPDVILLCANLYEASGLDHRTLKDGLYRAAQSERTHLRAAALGQLARLSLDSSDRDRLLALISVCFYNGVPPELLAALCAVQGPSDPIVEEIAARWMVLRRHFFTQNYQIQAEIDFVMGKVWELCKPLPY